MLEICLKITELSWVLMRRPMASYQSPMLAHGTGLLVLALEPLLLALIVAQ